MIQSESDFQGNGDLLRKESHDATEVDVQDNLRLPFGKKPGETVRKSRRIKVLPYVDFRQIIGLIFLFIWPVFLGTVFNIFGIGEVSDKLKIDTDSAHFLQCSNDVDEIVTLILTYQNTLQAKLFWVDQNQTIDPRILNLAKGLLRNFIEHCPEYSAVAPALIHEFEDQPGKEKLFSDGGELLSVVIEFSEMAISPRIYLVPPTGVAYDRGGMTWNSVLQKLIQSDMKLWVDELIGIGGRIYDFSYESQTLRAQFVDRYARVIMTLEVFQKYALPEFRLEQVQKRCTDCNWSGYRSKDYRFWWDMLPSLVQQEHDTTGFLSLNIQAVKAGVTNIINTTGNVAIINRILSEITYFPNKTKGTADKIFHQEFTDATHNLFALLAVTLIAFIVFTPLLVSIFVMFLNSLMNIFAESYRFQWIQLCRKRAIEREKHCSDRIVSEMFFELNFKYLFQKTLPPMVLYNETTVAFVEFLEYEELCKMYDVAYHISLLDWYYRLVCSECMHVYDPVLDIRLEKKINST